LTGLFVSHVISFVAASTTRGLAQAVLITGACWLQHEQRAWLVSTRCP
jgi:hypothetical protein